MNKKASNEEPGPEEQEGKDSVLELRFAGPGAADFGLKYVNVTPTQLLAAAEYLRLVAIKRIEERWARDMMQQVQEQQQVLQVQRALGRKGKLVG